MVVFTWARPAWEDVVVMLVVPDWGRPVVPVGVPVFRTPDFSWSRFLPFRPFKVFFTYFCDGLFS